MHDLKSVRAMILAEKIEDTNQILSVFNSSFSKWRINNTSYKHEVIEAVLIGTRKTRLFIIANRILLEVVKQGKNYNHQINGDEGMNTKFSLDFTNRLPFEGSTTAKIAHLLNNEYDDFKYLSKHG